MRTRAQQEKFEGGWRAYELVGMFDSLDSKREFRPAPVPLSEEEVDKRVENTD